MEKVGKGVRPGQTPFSVLDSGCRLNNGMWPPFKVDFIGFDREASRKTTNVKSPGHAGYDGDTSVEEFAQENQQGLREIKTRNPPGRPVGRGPYDPFLPEAGRVVTDRRGSGNASQGQCPMRQPRASMSGMSSSFGGMNPYRFGISTSGRVSAFITLSWPMMPFL